MIEWLATVPLSSKRGKPPGLAISLVLGRVKGVTAAIGWTLFVQPEPRVKIVIQVFVKYLNLLLLFTFLRCKKFPYRCKNE